MGRPTFLLALSAVAALSSLPAAADEDAGDTQQAAPAVGDDAVTLRDGTMLRGTLVTVAPNREVTILVAGNARTIAWSEIGQLEPGRFKAAPAAGFPQLVPSLFAPPAPPPRPGELGAPKIHIRSSTPVTLHEVTASPFGLVREITCQSPCDQVIDGRAGQTFYFAGDEIPSSERFHLIEKRGPVEATVSPGNAAVRTTGSALMIPAGLTLLASVILWPFAALTHDPATAGSLETAAEVVTSVAVLSLASSIAMLVGGKTRYSFRALGPDGIRL